VIVVIGRTSGAASAVARRIAARGAAAEIVAPVRPDAAGDKALAGLAAAGVRHAAVLRTGANRLEPADVELALRYLPDVRAIVVADDADGLGQVATEAAAWSSAPLVLVTDGAAPAEGEAGDGSRPVVVLQRPSADPDEAFAGFVAALAVRLEAGDDAAGAFESARRELGVEAVSGSSGRPRR
jgi:hypothetical protein